MVSSGSIEAERTTDAHPTGPDRAIRPPPRRRRHAFRVASPLPGRRVVGRGRERRPPLVQASEPLPLVRLRRRLAGLAVRHDGPAALQPRADARGHAPAEHRRPRRPGRQALRRLRDLLFHDRLGDRRLRLRHPRRPDRPGEDNAADDPPLLGLHRPERPLDGASYDFAFYRFLTGLGRGRGVRRRGLARGRGDAGQGPADGPRVAPGALGRRQHAGRGCSASALGEARRSRGRSAAPGGRCSSSACCRPSSRSSSSRGSRSPKSWKARRGPKLKADRAMPGSRTAATADRLGLAHRALRRPPLESKNTIVGMLLAFSGVVGLWGIGVFTPDLVRTIFNAHFTDLGLRPREWTDAVRLEDLRGRASSPSGRG